MARRDGPQAAVLVEDRARVAAVAVPVLVVAGPVLARRFLGDLGQLLGSWYG
jgi:hypothetical protein